MRRLHFSCFSGIREWFLSLPQNRDMKCLKRCKSWDLRHCASQVQAKTSDTAGSTESTFSPLSPVLTRCNCLNMQNPSAIQSVVLSMWITCMAVSTHSSKFFSLSFPFHFYDSSIHSSKSSRFLLIFWSYTYILPTNLVILILSVLFFFLTLPQTALFACIFSNNSECVAFYYL